MEGLFDLAARSVVGEHSREIYGQGLSRRANANCKNRVI
jgi:hypothetical protein